MFKDSKRELYNEKLGVRKMTETKTFKDFVLDEIGRVKGAYPSFDVYPQIQNAIETIAKNENEYIMQILAELKIDPDVLTKQKAEIERLSIENKQLKQKIEKMKNHTNCKFFHEWNLANVMEEPLDTLSPCQGCKNFNKWELAE